MLLNKTRRIILLKTSLREYFFFLRKLTKTRATNSLNRNKTTENKRKENQIKAFKAYKSEKKIKTRKKQFLVLHTK